MLRIDKTDRTTSFPTPPAKGAQDGFFRPSDALIGQKGTTLPFYFMNFIQESLRQVRIDAGVSEPTGWDQFDWLSSSINALVSQAVVIPGVISGLVIGNNGSDPDNDIDVSAGACADIGSLRINRLNSTFTKRLDASWASGTGNGGLFTGTKAINTTYHFCLIRNDSSGAIDFGFDTSVNGSNKPSGWSFQRRIGSIKTDGSGNIIKFIARAVCGGGINYVLRNPVENASYSGGASSVNTLALSNVPTGVLLDSKFHVLMSGESFGLETRVHGVDIYELARGTISIDNNAPPYPMGCTNDDSSVNDISSFELGNIFTDASAQVGVAINNALHPTYTISVKISCVGYIDHRTL